MTGFFVRIIRDGRPVNVELEDLTQDELVKWVSELDDAACRRWLVELVRWVGQKP